MSGFTTVNTDHLIRANLWSTQIREMLEAEMMGWKYVETVTDFPDGDTLNIPSIGQFEVNDYVENTPVKYSSADTGNFTFTIDQYKSSGTYITNKMKQDSYVMGQLVSKFAPGQMQAIKAEMEAKIMAVMPDAQTASVTNAINGADHRWVAQGANEVMSLLDFAKARHSLRKSFIGDQALIAIVDPSVQYELDTLTNLVNVSNNPHFEGIINEGQTSGLHFVKHIYGFDVYTSDYLKLLTASETIGSRTSAAGVCNLFFSARPDRLPILGHVRQTPTVESKYNQDMQRDEYVTVCRYGFKAQYPENTVVVISDTDRVL